MELGGPVSQISTCSETIVYVKTVSNERKKGIRKFEWTLVQMIPNDAVTNTRLTVYLA